MKDQIEKGLASFNISDWVDAHCGHIIDAYVGYPEVQISVEQECLDVHRHGVNTDSQLFNGGIAVRAIQAS